MSGKPTNPNADRLPPHSKEAEEGVLGCIMWDPVGALPECEAQLRDGEAFYDLRNQTVYNAMVSLSSEMKPVDPITLQQRLKDDGLLEQVGGIVHLMSLQDKVPSAANLSYYLDIVRDKAALRRLVRTCTDIVGRAYGNEGEANTVIDLAERDILAVRPQAKAARTVKDMVRNAIDQLEASFHKGDLGGISTGLRDLDRKTDGLHPGEMIVIAAFPGGGKSALAGGIADHVAVDLGMPVGIFSLEMTGEEYLKRMISSRARVDLRSKFEEEDFKKMTVASAKLANAPLFIEDGSDMTIGQLRARARKLHQKHKIKLWIIDYLQIVQPPGSEQNRELEVARISEGIKNMAQELQAPVIALSQLNEDGRLRESRRIGQDAASVWKLNAKEGCAVDLFIEKQRNGPALENVPLVFLKNITRFECPALISEEDIPKNRKQHND